jgi:hypothetical protein
MGPVIKARSFEMLVIRGKAKGMNEVESCIGSPAQTGYGAGIGRNFGLDKNYMQVMNRGVAGHNTLF